MTIDFKNLIVGRHESKVLFIWNLEKGVAMLGAFRGIKDGIEAGIMIKSFRCPRTGIKSGTRSIGDAR